MSTDTMEPDEFVLEIYDEFGAYAEEHCLSEARKAESQGNLLLAAAWQKNAVAVVKVLGTHFAVRLC